MSNAKLKFYYSVMNAGKTTQLLQTDNIYKRKGYKTLIIKPSVDDREGEYNGWGTIESRLIKENTPCLYVDEVNPKELSKLNPDIIFVDEAQFFTKKDIYNLSEITDKQNIPVSCYGLKTDINGNLFEGSKALLALADEIKEIEQICDCGEKATIHLRYVDNKLEKEGSSVAIEKGKTTYESVCRKCWKDKLGR